MRSTIAALVLALLTAAGCGDPSGDATRGAEPESFVAGRVLASDGTPAAGATVLVYRATDVSDETGEPEEDTRWFKTRLSCDEAGRFRIRLGTFRLVQLVARVEQLPDEASEPVLAGPGEDVVLRLP